MELGNIDENEVDADWGFEVAKHMSAAPTTRCNCGEFNPERSFWHEF